MKTKIIIITAIMITALLTITLSITFNGNYLNLSAEAQSIGSNKGNINNALILSELFSEVQDR